MAHTFINKNVEELPSYREEDRPLFERIREITTHNRPPGSHGCQLTEIVPGLWTAHFNDIDSPDSFTKLPISPSVGLVVNAAVAYGQCPTYSGFYGPDIEVLEVQLFDDPKEGEPHDFPSDLNEVLPGINAAIKRTINSGKSVLVHCMASLSRSVALILGYLIEHEGQTLLDATAFVKNKWDATWPNDSFVFQLIAFQKSLGSRK